ncbi:MAG: SPOR domain-containing protein [Alphaproteobacteria bacterium]|nr:SPOR domain-containing protein [Alphaproteobacteria bacterium]
MYYVQAGTFRDRRNAETMANRLRRHFDDVLVHSSTANNGRVLHRVRIGPENSRQSAKALQARVQARGSRDAFVVRSTG